MSVMFAEYKIMPEKRERYLEWMSAMRQTEPSFEWLEGTDQPNLFVEIWPDVSEERYRLLKSIRKEHSDSPWAGLGDFVLGGLEKVHIWHFRPMPDLL